MNYDDGGNPGEKKVAMEAQGCQPTTRHYFFSLIAWTRVRHCLHPEYQDRSIDKDCKGPKTLSFFRKECCRCPFTTPWTRWR